ncbi:hypothetical protein AV530_000283 [Patagioenas fasciata monilis]|uniref:Uncharacterized protein n=1 Tax=Patagioenas fasciata monilis TaxID=372326 RepID=A0A1V4KZU4_PATFA|nr:hypothetical protein AV530_000283 [Patagioenas fasciata monilis]
MSAGPQLQLALLWPWLLMATLQAGLGQKGLAAAVESERAAAQKAIIRVIPLKVEPIILEGEFANVAEVTPAEGKLLQLKHPDLARGITHPAACCIVRCLYPNGECYPDSASCGVTAVCFDK